MLFCDEATGALDEKNSKNVVELLTEIKKKYGMTIVFVTHNLEIAKVSERIITMKNGMIVNDKINKRQIHADEMKWD
jgi:putative ABC transport system ATP-binding protein